MLAEDEEMLINRLSTWFKHIFMFTVGNICLFAYGKMVDDEFGKLCIYNNSVHK